MNCKRFDVLHAATAMRDASNRLDSIDTDSRVKSTTITNNQSVELLKNSIPQYIVWRHFIKCGWFRNDRFIAHFLPKCTGDYFVLKICQLYCRGYGPRWRKAWRLVFHDSRCIVGSLAQKAERTFAAISRYHPSAVSVCVIYIYFHAAAARSSHIW